MTVSVFVGTSLDGFIARANGDFDFLPEGGGEPHGYDEFMALSLACQCSLETDFLSSAPYRTISGSVT